MFRSILVILSIFVSNFFANAQQFKDLKLCLSMTYGVDSNDYRDSALVTIFGLPSYIGEIGYIKFNKTDQTYLLIPDTPAVRSLYKLRSEYDSYFLLLGYPFKAYLRVSYNHFRNLEAFTAELLIDEEKNRLAFKKIQYSAARTESCTCSSK